MHDGKELGNWDEFLGKSSSSLWSTEYVLVAGEKVVPFFQPIMSIASGRIVG